MWTCHTGVHPLHPKRESAVCDEIVASPSRVRDHNVSRAEGGVDREEYKEQSSLIEDSTDHGNTRVEVWRQWEMRGSRLSFYYDRCLEQYHKKQQKKKRQKESKKCPVY